LDGGSNEAVVFEAFDGDCSTHEFWPATKIGQIGADDASLLSELIIKVARSPITHIGTLRT
jgi:hypothetical protein